MAKDMTKTPAPPVANPPAGHKGSSGVFDGKTNDAFGKYPRTPSKDGVPEKHYDEAGPFGQF